MQDNESSKQQILTRVQPNVGRCVSYRPLSAIILHDKSVENAVALNVIDDYMLGESVPMITEKQFRRQTADILLKNIDWL